MKRTVSALVVVACTAVGSGAAWAKPAKAPKVATAAALAAAVSNRGLGCDLFFPSSPATGPQPPGGPPVGDAGECAIDGENVSLTVYDRTRDVGRALEAMPVVCRYAIAILGPVTFTFVTARNWSIAFMTDDLDPRFASALGARQSEVDCADIT